MELLLIGIVEAGSAGPAEPHRVGRDERFTEDDEPAAATAGLCDALNDLRDGGITIQKGRGRLVRFLLSAMILPSLLLPVDGAGIAVSATPQVRLWRSAGYGIFPIVYTHRRMESVLP